jgi:uridine phosphorylase
MADIQVAFLDFSGWSVLKPVPYVVRGDSQLYELLDSDQVIRGFTATNSGFYGPQGRSLRLALEDPEINNKITAFRFGDLRITNMEMETAGIFGLAALMGHHATAVNCILANRIRGTFSGDPAKAVDLLIRYTLEKLTA